MNNPPLSPRRPDESDKAWHARVRSYVRKNAPKEQRYFVRGGKPGGKAQRWILPGVFVVIGLFIAGMSYGVIGGTIRDLNGPNGAEGDFFVQSIQEQKDSHGKVSYVPVVTIRDQNVVPLMSYGHEFAVDSAVHLRYSQSGPVAASFTDEHGKAPMTSVNVGVGMGAGFILIGVLVGLFYRGAADPAYVDRETARLTSS